MSGIWALIWLQKNSKLYSDIIISKEWLESLPEDRGPTEIFSIVQHKEDANMDANE